MVKAVCVVNGDGVTGVVHFRQATETDAVTVTGTVKGLTEGDHGFHVHEFGNLTKGCETAGGHYNPHGKNHGGRDGPERHAGDLANVAANAGGVAEFEFSVAGMKLIGAESVIGRSLVIHAQPDDLGMGGHPDSLKTGNSGARVACGVIGIDEESRKN